MKSIIRLFRAVLVKDSSLKKKPSNFLLNETIERGFIFSPIVINNYSRQELVDLIKMVEKEVGLSPIQMNSLSINHGLRLEIQVCFN